MPDFHAYVPAALSRLLDDVLRLAPHESLSSLFAQAVRARHAELTGCQHAQARCVVCGAVVTPDA